MKWILLSVFCVFATELCGVIKIPTSLVLSKSPYTVTGDLYVPVNSRLSIEAGVELLIDKGESCNEVKQVDWNDSQMVSIKVDGSFFVEGSPEMPVVIRPLEKNHKSVSWDGIRLRDRNRLNTQIQFMHISGAHRAIYAKRSVFHISNSIFEKNSTGLYLDLNANLNISNSIFYRNYTAGIYQKKAAPNIVSSIFYENDNYGIWSDSRNAINIQNNAFWGNIEFDCFHCPAHIGKLLQEEEDSTAVPMLDKEHNYFTDPIFVGTEGETAAKHKDLQLDTPDSLILDKEIAMMEKKARPTRKMKAFEPRGMGPFLLSKYSPLMNMGYENDFFQNEDGSRNDIGLHGGKRDLVKERFVID